jgi:hypothetical protein
MQCGGSTMQYEAVQGRTRQWGSNTRQCSGSAVAVQGSAVAVQRSMRQYNALQKAGEMVL